MHVPKQGSTLRCDRCNPVNTRVVVCVLNADTVRMSCGHILYRTYRTK